MSGAGGLNLYDTGFAAQWMDLNYIYSAASSASAASSGADNPIMYFRNPNASGVKMIILNFFANTAVTNVVMEYKVYANPTVSANGTTVDIFSRNIGNSAPAAQGLVTTLPTVTSVGSRLAWTSNGQNSNAESVVSEAFLTVQPNNNFLFVADPSSNGRAVNFTIVWAEVPL